jgi:hypothetical protein
VFSSGEPKKKATNEKMIRMEEPKVIHRRNPRGSADNY